jgi:hypothetical protein
MSLDISTEIEERLREKAREHGISVEALLERLLKEAPEPHGNGGPAALPSWDLGAIGSLSRVEIYDDDVR